VRLTLELALCLLAISAIGLTWFLIVRADRKRSFDERRYALMETLPDALFIVDDRWRFTHLNESAEVLFGQSAYELVGKRIDKLFDPLASEIFPEMVRARSAESPIEFVQTFSSTGRALAIRVQPSSAETLVYMRDVTERRLTEQRLREGERRLRLLLQQVPAMVWTADLDMRLSSASGSTLDDYALSEQEIIGKRVDEVFASPERSESMTDTIKRVFHGESLRYETHHNDRWLRHEIEPLRDTDNSIVGVIGAALDITDVKATSKAFERQARVDVLTALPNRLALEEQLDAMLDAARRERRRMAVMFVDLDRFKIINDSLGHRAGDEVLRGISGRLEALLRGRARVFRTGGDEFVILTDGDVTPDGVATMAEEILAAFEAPIHFEGRELVVSASIGASLYPDNAIEPGELVKQADSAMYRAKDAGRQNAKFYSGAMHARILERMSLELDLRHALAREEFELHYQPIVEVAGEKTIGAEALLRWKHPAVGEVFPDRFVGIAEEIGAIVEITAWVLDEACAFASAVRAMGLREFRIAVNLSARDLCEPDVGARIAAALERARLPASALDLEITERITLNDAAVKALIRLQSAGLRIVVDDFGIGYSSLDYIKRLPVGAVKIDRSFVADVAHSPHDQAIVKAITTLAHGLKLGVVAEGIETAAQRDFMLSAGVGTAQGYFFGRPVARAQFLNAVEALPECAEQSRAARVVPLFRQVGS